MKEPKSPEIQARLDDLETRREEAEAELADLRQRALTAETDAQYWRIKAGKAEGAEGRAERLGNELLIKTVAMGKIHREAAEAAELTDVDAMRQALVDLIDVAAKHID